MSHMAGSALSAGLKYIAAAAVTMTMLPLGARSPEQYRVTASVESIRKDALAVLAADAVPETAVYRIIAGDKAIGTVNIISYAPVRTGAAVHYRIMAGYFIDPGQEKLFIAGSRIALENRLPGPPVKTKDEFVKVETVYKPSIVTPRDGRVMVLVSGGRAYIGSDADEPDERPRHMVTMEPFYIDKYEVSNDDYHRYVRETGAAMPGSWNGRFNPDAALLPVLVSYPEAERYARWAGKLLPEEAQWEKAANGISRFTQVVRDDGLMEIVESTRYPWGNEYDRERANAADFWTGLQEYRGWKKGLLPVYFLEDRNASAWGAVNMTGNAAEWTSSWYDRYENSRASHRRFGRQVKVVRGGSWFSPSGRLRNTARDFGGIPSLHDDRSFGFRCIKRGEKGDELGEKRVVP